MKALSRRLCNKLNCFGFRAGIFLKKLTNWWGQAKGCATKLRHIAIGGGIFDRTFNFDQSQSTEADDIISGVAIDWIGVDVRQNVLILC